MTFKQIIIGEIVVFFILNLFFRYTKIGKRIVLLPSELKGRRKHRITLRKQLATRKEELKTYTGEDKEKILSSIADCEKRLKNEESEDGKKAFILYASTFALLAVFIAAIGIADKRAKAYNPKYRKEYCERILEEKYGKGFTVDQIYGGDYSGVYNGKAHADDEPNLIFTFSNNRRIDTDEAFSDNYAERKQEEVYKKEFDEIFGGYGIDYYLFLTVANKNYGDYENPDYKIGLIELYVSSEWLSDTDDEIWTVEKVITEKYGNHYLIFVTDEDLQMIKDEYSGTDKMSTSTSSYLNERYSIDCDCGEVHHGALIVGEDYHDEFMSDMEQIRKNELFQ